MPFLSWLISRMMQFFLGNAHDRRANAAAREKETGTFENNASAKGRNFEDDYRSATKMLKARVDKQFPDSYYARLSSNNSSSYDYGQDRALAVDTMSTAIAMALREGATVRQAADAGAASVGI